MSIMNHENNIELIKRMSADKSEPAWLLDMRLKSYGEFMDKSMPDWGPSLTDLDMGSIRFYIPPELAESESWEDLPDEVKNTFDKLGIPEAEKQYLGGVGAQYDSGMVYHRILDSLAAQGVIFENMDKAVHLYPELVREHFAKCIGYNEHKFSLLHYAFWSGGTFIYVPKGVKVSMPLQAYFRMNAISSGQFEHTLIIADEGSSIEYIEGCSAPRYNSSSIHAGGVEIFVKKGAKVKYSSIENWSRNTFNLNTKKALVYERGHIEWLNGNMGSAVTMLYPTSVLLGDYAENISLGIVMASEGQVQDTGSKVIHLGSHTSSIIKSKSISRDGGVSEYRGFVQVGKKAEHTVSHVDCDALMLDDISSSHTWPTYKVENNDANITHEAKVGRVDEAGLFYLSMHGLSEEEGLRAIVGGYMSEVVKKLPLEYAIELNKLIDLEMEKA